MLFFRAKLLFQVSDIIHPGQNDRPKCRLLEPPDILCPKLCQKIQEYLIVGGAVYFVYNQDKGLVRSGAYHGQFLEKRSQGELRAVNVLCNVFYCAVERLSHCRSFNLKRIQKRTCEGGGAETLAAASILTVSQAWAGESLEESCYMVLHYPDACPVIVSFWGGDGLMESTATLLIGTALEEDSIPDMAKLFQQLGIAGMHVQELEIDED